MSTLQAGADVRAAVDLLRTTTTIRARAQQLLRRARADESAWFVVDDGRLDVAAEVTAATTRARYPDLDIPFHSRWRHFEAGGIDRRGEFSRASATDDRAMLARAMIDVTVVAVLLDAGAGPQWSYREASTGLEFSRSEGLGVAAWRAFEAGAFSSEPSSPPRVDATGLRRLTTDGLMTAFQIGPDNQLVGLAGRLALLHRLADALEEHPEVFGASARPGGLYDHLLASGNGTSVAADDILRTILTALQSIWSTDAVIGDIPLGDCWHHDAVAGPGLSAGWVPFHKLSQWLTYSLIEPFQWSGVEVKRLDMLTALPEYRNGGLLLDTGVLTLRDADWAQRSWRVQDELVVEWRALTVALLDELTRPVRALLDTSSDAMPLACVLEGGTWAAGRELAASLRGGLPPLRIVSDGTVF